MQTSLGFAVTCAVVVSVGAAAAAETNVGVRFVEPDGFVDAGRIPSRRDQNPTQIANHLEKLGRDHLQSGYRLDIDVLDVDLAGIPRPTPSTDELRIVSSGADRPGFKLRYTLEANGRVIRRGEDSLADLGFLYRFTPQPVSDPLHHEKRLLNQWFADRFDSRTAAGS